MKNEIVLCDQKGNGLIAYEVHDMTCPTWEWHIDAPDFGNVSGVKRRHHPMWGDVVLVVASEGFTGVVAYPSGELLFRAHGTGNLHSIELLPDGRVMTVGSDGNVVRVYTDPETYTAFYADFPHGVLYDPERNWVWVLARHSLVAYEADDFSSPVQTFVFPDDMVEGHDLAPVYGDTNRLFLTVLSGVFVYDKTANTVSRFSLCKREHVKGIGNLLDSETVLCVTPNGYDKPWCSDKIYRYDENGETEISVPETAIYKLRIFCDKYQ